MNKLFHPLLVMIAKATSTELQRYIDYPKAENQILRSKLPQRVVVTPAKREKLVKVGKPPGGKLKELMSIVSPRTFTRWANGETKSVGKKGDCANLGNVLRLGDCDCRRLLTNSKG
jgi:putative transposase